MSIKPLSLIRYATAFPLRRRFPRAPLLAALWLIACAPVTVRGQDSAPPPPAVAERAAPPLTAGGGTKPSDAPPATKEPPAPSQAEVSPDAVGQVAPRKKNSAPAVPADNGPGAEDSAAATPEETGTAAPAETDAAAPADEVGGGFRWKAAAEQTLLFLGVQHGYALTQPKTRRDLHGPFFRDYFRSARSIGGWGDGGRFFTNYVAHPMQGALLGHVWVQNDPKGKAVPFGRSKAYRRSRAKAFAWSAAWSTQFELGPVSQASIGNVGLHGKQTWVDVVVTPVGGTAWLVAEDALDRFVVQRIERRTDNRFVRIVARMIFNPTRTGANLLRFEKPWRRDR